ncbi:alpha/beta hydrolase [Acrocarpospora phusangensis]|uniref:Alpha/beta hydrolase n=1 Tax=Acrocarpospora phusangensis TaxID=1070424 RepID=A0A919QF36_9ACTN|nr:alpha/beta fold hydrolase [Acrocarpospora phusangensis]GIH25092.1 alpha/beta hydrolase [Acrocarpospora phusangensis]
MREPVVEVTPARGEVKGVALVLHGGQEVGHGPTSGRQLAVLRMLPFAWALTRAGAHRGLAVWRVRYRVRGWNGSEASPVADVNEILARLRNTYDVPVILVGHSMGGRTALRVAGNPNVAGVAALAPWVPAGEPVAQLAGRHVLFVHGTADRTTTLAATRAYAERARQVAADVRMIDIPGEGHAMLRHPGLWHRLTTEFALSLI